jgi:hypothetical protein
MVSIKISSITLFHACAQIFEPILHNSKSCIFEYLIIYLSDLANFLTLYRLGMSKIIQHVQDTKRGGSCFHKFFMKNKEKFNSGRCRVLWIGLVHIFTLSRVQLEHFLARNLVNLMKLSL